MTFVIGRACPTTRRAVFLIPRLAFTVRGILSRLLAESILNEEQRYLFDAFGYLVECALPGSPDATQAIGGKSLR